MTCPTKWQRQAKQQRASQAKAFDSGFIEDLLEIALDPDYKSEPDSDMEPYSSSNADSLSNGMSFGLMNTSEIEEDMRDSDDEEEYDVDSGACTDVSKWQWTGDDFTNTIVQFQATDKTDDYVEICAHQAAITAYQFWLKTMVKSPVSVVNIKKSD